MNCKFWRSFNFALAGIFYALRTQYNMRFHFFAAGLVLIAAFLLDIGTREWVMLFFAIALVLVTEMFNTAVETVVDLSVHEYHHLAKVAKDLAAGAVLLATINSVIIGLLVFYPYLASLVRHFLR